MSISKELLSEVLGEEIDFVRSGFNGTIGTENQYKYRIKHKPQVKYINIYQLAHKCKEWVLDNTNYSLSSWLSTTVHHGHKNKIGDGVAQIGSTFMFADTEPEAIFKACEWIKDNK